MGIASFNRATHFFQEAQATYGYLLDRVGSRQSDQFSSSCQEKVLEGTLVIGLITEPLGFVQDAQDVMVLFDEWLAVLVLCSVRVLDEPSAGRRRLYVMTAWW